MDCGRCASALVWARARVCVRVCVRMRVCMVGGCLCVCFCSLVCVCPFVNIDSHTPTGMNILPSIPNHLVRLARGKGKKDTEKVK